MNLVGWILVVVGAAGILTCIGGRVCAFLQRTPAELLASSAGELYLHDTYYLVSRPVWPMLLCLVLSAAISIVRYMHTERFVRSMIPTESNSPEWQSPPNDA